MSKKLIAILLGVLVIGITIETYAAPVTYSFRANNPVFGYYVRDLQGHYIDSNAIATGTFTYDNEYDIDPHFLGKGSISYHGAVNNISFSIGGLSYFAPSAHVIIGNDVYPSDQATHPVDYMDIRSTTNGFQIGNLLLTEVMFWWFEDWFGVPDFYDNQDLPCQPPNYRGRLVLRFLDVATGQADSIQFYDLNVYGTETCINNPDKTEPGICGCCLPDIDSDGDTIMDCMDICPNDSPDDPDNDGICGCLSDTDSDGDGVIDCIDICPNDNPDDPDNDGICGDSGSIIPIVTAVPAGGTYLVRQWVELHTDEPANIFYTTDGSTPTLESYVYFNPILVDSTTNLKFVAVDNFGNQSEVATEAYTINIDPIWTLQTGTPIGEVPDGSNGVIGDNAKDVQVDAEGNIYVLGNTEGNLDGNYNRGLVDVFLAKYDPEGNNLWTRFTGEESLELGNALTIDSSGNAYFVGETNGYLDGNYNYGGFDLFVIKYDTDGNKLWTKQLGSIVDEEAIGVAVDSHSDIYVVGHSYGVFNGGPYWGGADLIVFKLDGLGNLIWSRQLGTPTHDLAMGVSVDDNSNIYITGYSYGGFNGNISAGGTDIIITKYDKYGNLLWSKQSGTSRGDRGLSVTVDQFGNAYLTGWTLGALDGNTSNGRRDIFLMKYDPDGNKLWTKQAGTPGSDSGLDVVISGTQGTGYVNVVGFTDDSLGGYASAGQKDVAVLQYDYNGNLLWTKQMGTPGNDISNAMAVYIPSSTTYVVGQTEGGLDGNINVGNWDAFIMKFGESVILSDSDNDGYYDTIDNCPNLFNDDQSDIDEDLIGDACDVCPDIVDDQSDSDSDGFGDACESCPYDQIKIEPGICGCGVEDTDTDGDGSADCIDLCPYDLGKIEPGICGCGVEDLDADIDGYFECIDDCDDSDYFINPGVSESCDHQDNNCNGNIDEGFDADNDSIPDCGDNCSSEANPDQSDVDVDGVGDVCDICPADSTDTCDTYRSAGESIGAEGSSFTTPDGSVSMTVPPGALTSERSLSITALGQSYELVTSHGNGTALYGVKIEPEGQEFAVPITIVLAWDDIDNDGIIDGTNINEDDLIVSKDNVVITGVCSNDLGCDTLTNTFSIKVSSLSEFVLLVLNGPPEVGEVIAPGEPLQMNTAVDVSSFYTDTGFLDTHTAIWNWGDGNTTYGTIIEANGVGSITGSHIYTETGVYNISLTVADNYGESDTAIFQYVVIYDPDGGFATGGGWIDSPEGAYVSDSTLTGMANFGFVSKYKKGASVPTGNTEFQFKVADLNFHSDSYEWLVVAGASAKFKGVGTINGQGEYKFMLTAVDANININDSFYIDSFRIKIWTEDEGGEVVVYDNALGDDSDNATTEIGGGSIVIHKGK